MQDALGQINETKPDSRDPMLQRILQNWQLRRFQPQAPVQQADQIKSDIATLRFLKTVRPQQADLYEKLIAALTFDFWLRNPDRPRSAYYFGGGKKPDELLDFAVWRHQ